MNPNKTPEIINFLQSAPKSWAGKVDGKKTSASPETINAVNAHLATYETRRNFLSKHLRGLKGNGDIFFGVPVELQLRNYKKFKLNLLKKALEEPEVMYDYIKEFQEAHLSEAVIRPFAKDEKIAILASRLNSKLFDEWEIRLHACVVSSLNNDVVSMIETLMMKSLGFDNQFNEKIWRETQDILPIFHNQHLQFLYYFFSLFLINTKTSVLPASMKNQGSAIIAIVRKVVELC